MYKIVFVVAVFAFALQGALSSPVETEASPAQQLAQQQTGNVKTDASKTVDNKPAGDTPTVTTTEAAATTTAPKSGASSTEMCLLLVQVSSLALVAKHMLL